jgi:hypothetical protein
VKRSALASRSHSTICAICETSGLPPCGHNGALCLVCGNGASRDVLGTLRQIITLADTLGSHACEECEHSEMPLLLDRVSHCPECSSEVLPKGSECRTQAVSRTGTTANSETAEILTHRQHSGSPAR